MVSIWVVELDTPSFAFRAYGRSEGEARYVLAMGWEKHCKQTGAERDYVNARTDGNAYEVKPGQCWRDDAILESV